MKTGWQNHVKLDNYLDECGLLDQVLDGIDKIPWREEKQEKALGLLSSYKMGLITKSTHVAGRFSPRNEEIQLHEELLKPGREKDRDDTLLHEIGHLLTELVYKEDCFPCFGRKRNPHGREWKSIVSLLGGNNSRCHNYEYFKELQAAKAKHEYTCLDCGEKIYTQRKLKNMDRRSHTPCRFKENNGRFSHRVLR